MSEVDYTLTTPPSIASLPEPVPSRSGSQPNFQARANEFLAHLPTYTDHLNQAIQWLKESVDKMDEESSSIAGNLQSAIQEIEDARSSAIDQIEQDVIELLEGFSNPMDEMKDYRDQVIQEIEDAKQAAIQYINDHCGG